MLTKLICAELAPVSAMSIAFFAIVVNQASTDRSDISSKISFLMLVVNGSSTDK